MGKYLARRRVMRTGHSEIHAKGPRGKYFPVQHDLQCNWGNVYFIVPPLLDFVDVRYCACEMLLHMGLDDFSRAAHINPCDPLHTLVCCEHSVVGRVPCKKKKKRMS